MSFTTLEANAIFSFALDIEVKVLKLEQLFQKNQIKNEEYFENKKIIFELMSIVKEKMNQLEMLQKGEADE